MNSLTQVSNPPKIIKIKSWKKNREIAELLNKFKFQLFISRKKFCLLNYVLDECDTFISRIKLSRLLCKLCFLCLTLISLISRGILTSLFFRSSNSSKDLLTKEGKGCCVSTAELKAFPDILFWSFVPKWLFW